MIQSNEELEKRLRTLETAIRMLVPPEERQKIDELVEKQGVANAEQFAIDLGFYSFSDMQCFISELRATRQQEQQKLQDLVNEARNKGWVIY